MTNINPNAAAAREASRATSGQFGEQHRPDADVALADFKAKAANSTLSDIASLKDDFEKVEFVAAVEEATRIVKEQFPSAVELELENVNDGPGSPYWAPKGIFDADGKPLWASEGMDDPVYISLEGTTPVLDRLGKDAVDLTPDHHYTSPKKRYGIRFAITASTEPVNRRLNFTSSQEEAIDWDGRGPAPRQMSESSQRYVVWGELVPGTWVPAYRGDDAAQAQKVANEHDERMNVKFFDTSSSPR